MEKKIEKQSLAIISKLPQICKPNEFMVAYFIINTMYIKKSDRVKIYRGQLADQCNMSERNISRITESLNEIGIIQKELIGDAEKKKTFNYYRLNWQFIDEFFARFDNEEGTFLPELSGLKKERKEEIKEKKEIKEKNKKIEVKKTFIEEPKQSKSSTVEDGDCDKINWSKELIQFEHKIKRASSLDEIRLLSSIFSSLQDKQEIPIELEEMAQRVQNTAIQRTMALKCVPTHVEASTALPF